MSISSQTPDVCCVRQATSLRLNLLFPEALFLAHFLREQQWQKFNISQQTRLESQLSALGQLASQTVSQSASQPVGRSDESSGLHRLASINKLAG